MYIGCPEFFFALAGLAAPGSSAEDYKDIDTSRDRE